MGALMTCQGGRKGGHVLPTAAPCAIIPQQQGQATLSNPLPRRKRKRAPTAAEVAASIDLNNPSNQGATLQKEAGHKTLAATSLATGRPAPALPRAARYSRAGAGVPEGKVLLAATGCCDARCRGLLTGGLAASKGGSRCAACAAGCSPAPQEGCALGADQRRPHVLDCAMYCLERGMQPW